MELPVSYLIIGITFISLIAILFFYFTIIKKKKKTPIEVPSKMPETKTNKEKKVDATKINKSEKPLFDIKENKLPPKIPDLKDPRSLNIRYPLIEPYAYVTIKWDEKSTELIYKVEEPELEESEKKTLKTLEKGIGELINLSYISSKEKDIVLIYLEKNIRVLLSELSIKITKKTFLKLMYYIYRDFVGLNLIEPLLNDYYIEDIECNGVNTPIYIVHRKYSNIKTNIIYEEVASMATFVEKLAQKCGKYVSYAEPILDGALPDGSRVNATYTKDITSRGPTFTIRKFTREPWSPIQLMQKGTVSPEILSYAWMCIEYGHSFMVIGGTGSGKCVTGDTVVHLPDGSLVEIKKMVEDKFTQGVIKSDNGWEYVEASEEEVLSMDLDSLKIKPKKITRFWRHKAPKELIKVTTRSGRTVTTTPEHPFFGFEEGSLTKIRADKLKKYERIAVPRDIKITTKKEKKRIISMLTNEKDLYVQNGFTELNLALNKLNKTKKQLAIEYGCTYRTLCEWFTKNAMPLNIYSRLMDEANIKIKENIILKSKSSKFDLKIPDLCPQIFRFVSLVISDGHLTKSNVALFNNNKKLLTEFLSIGKDLFGIKGKIEYPKDRTPKAIFYSSALSKVLSKVFEIPYGKKSHSVKVPTVLFNQEKESIFEFISGIIDAEGHISKDYIEISTASKQLAQVLSTLFLRMGILTTLVTRKDHLRIYIYSQQNFVKLNKLINLRHNKKNHALITLIKRNLAHQTPNLDTIPNVNNLLKELRMNKGWTQNQFAQSVGVSRRLVGMWEKGTRNTSINTFSQVIDSLDLPHLNHITESNIYWDEVVNIEVLTNHKEKYVYDLTVDGSHNFLAGQVPLIVHNTSFLNALAFFFPPQARVVTIEDTRELTLEHENWLPSVARAGVGLGNILGQKHGEVSLFDLLRASFRQRPDYIIVGEIRGKEAYVLFQAFASLRGNEEIFVLMENKPKRIPIKDLKEGTKYQAITFDQKGNSKILPVTAKIKHPSRKKLYRVITKSGREVTITPDHSVFTYKKGKLMEKTLKDLKKGDSIIVPSKIPCGYADIKHINLIEFIKGIRVYAPKLIKEASRKLGYDKASKIVGVATISGYYANFKKRKPNAMLIENFKKLMNKANIDFNHNNLKVRFNGSKIINANLELSNDLLKLMGYYISEGNVNHSGRNGSINLYNKDPLIIKDMKRIIMKLNKKKPRERKCERGFGEAMELSFSNKILSEFLVQSCNKKNNKRIPDFIFGLSKKKVGIFLTTLFEGDGSINRDELAYYTTSHKLANDVAQILLIYGALARITKRQRKGRKTKDYEILLYRADQRRNVLKYLKPITKKIKLTQQSRPDKKFINDIYLDEIKEVKKLILDKPEPVYDISVPGTQNFVGGFGGILLHNSGHPGAATMHAEDVSTMIRRLETNPINLSGSLVMSLSVVFVIEQTKIKGKSARVVSSVDEIIEVKENLAGETTNKVFKWNPANLTFDLNPNSKIFKDIATHYGYSISAVQREFKYRANLLRKLYSQGIVGFKEVQEVIQQYYKSPGYVLRKYGVI